MRLDAGGITVDLPRRWEGTVATGRGLDADTVARQRAATGEPPAMRPAAHLGNFALPAERGDFGTGAVDVMGHEHAFVALVEFGPSEAHTPLFRAPRLPRRVTAGDFSPRMLQRTLPGQCGMQVFATEAGRPLCLYVVLGRRRDLGGLADEVSSVLATLEVTPR